MTNTTHKYKPAAVDYDAHAAALYRAMALRMYSRYTDLRKHAEFCGGDFADHGKVPTQFDVSERYKALVDECVYEPPNTPAAVLALVEFAALIAADNLVGEALRDPTGPAHDEADRFHQVVALAAAAEWLNRLTMGDWVERMRAAKGGAS